MKKSDVVLGLKVSLVRDGAVPRVSNDPCDSPARVATLARQFIPAGEEREHLLVILCDSRTMVKGVAVISVGTLSAALVHPREVFRPAIVAGAAGIILVHNHPSGDANPSSDDRDTTRRIGRAGELLGIPCVDHVIIGDEGGACATFSFHEHGLLS
jgi:DNA repair protein RadC